MQEQATVTEQPKSELEARLEELKAVVGRNAAYQKLRALWTEAEVEKYLMQVARENQAEALQFIAEIRSGVVSGIATDFHERFEMQRLEEIVDARVHEGAYRAALGEGTSEQYEVFDVESSPNEPSPRFRKMFFPYFEAHPQALRAEMEFLEAVGLELGVELSRLALFVARPVFWDEFAATRKTVEEFYLDHRKSNLMVKSDVDDEVYPVTLPDDFATQLAQAQQFFLDYGSEYVVLPTVILERNGLK